MKYDWDYRQIRRMSENGHLEEFNLMPFISPTTADIKKIIPTHDQMDGYIADLKRSIEREADPERRRVKIIILEEYINLKNEL